MFYLRPENLFQILINPEIIIIINNNISLPPILSMDAI
jgi:hypothetical protein